MLIPFATSYLCVKEFSFVIVIKTKYRNRLLSLENNLFLCVSDVEPQIKQLLNVKQIQRSHQLFILLCFLLIFYVHPYRDNFIIIIILIFFFNKKS
jgi:hypothetical protein